MIRKPNFKLNWKYAFGEIALIFVGISLAIAFQNWNENRKQIKVEADLLTQLRQDLVGLKDELEVDIEAAQNIISLTDSILFYDSIGSQKPFIGYFLRSGKETFLSDVQVFPTSATYENLKSIGLEIISDVELRNRVIDLYDRKLVRAREWESLVYQYEDRMVVLAEKNFKTMKGVSGQKYPVFAPESYQAFKDNKEVYHALISYQKVRTTTISRYKDVELLVNDLLELLKSKGLKND
ncbi:MAG TPA: DUF6090 family protein [Roseivirga sp.]